MGDVPARHNRPVQGLSNRLPGQCSETREPTAIYPVKLKES